MSAASDVYKRQIWRRLLFPCCLKSFKNFLWSGDSSIFAMLQGKVWTFHAKIQKNAPKLYCQYSTSSGYLPYVFRNSSTCIGSSVLSLYASQLIEFILDMPLHSLALIFAPNSTLALLFPLTMGRTYG